MRNFNIYLKAAGVTGDDAQVNTFLYVVGEDDSEIYYALMETKRLWLAQLRS